MNYKRLVREIYHSFFLSSKIFGKIYTVPRTVIFNHFLVVDCKLLSLNLYPLLYSNEQYGKNGRNQKNNIWENLSQRTLFSLGFFKGIVGFIFNKRFKKILVTCVLQIKRIACCDLHHLHGLLELKFSVECNIKLKITIMRVHKRRRKKR